MIYEYFANCIMKGTYTLTKEETLWELESMFQCMIDDPYTVKEYMDKISKSGQTIDRYQQEFECGIDWDWKIYLNYNY